MPKFLNRMKKGLLLLFIALTQMRPLRGEILEAPRIAVLESLLEQADRNTLVLWDVDDVLVQPTDAFYMEVPLRKRLYERIWLKYSKTERKALFSHFFLRREVMLVHPRVLEVLKGLEQKGIPCAALTAWWTGPYGSIPKMEDLRFQGLASVGISFAGSCPFNEQRFDALATAEGVPLIQQGVIFTALQDKALVLAAVLEGREKDFSKIIFIEDNISNLKAVEKLCRKLKIPFLGIHYTEAASRPLPQLEPAQEKERFRILEDEGLWLLDEELQERLEPDTSEKSSRKGVRGGLPPEVRRA